MALIRDLLGTNEDGSPHYWIHSSDGSPLHVVRTRPGHLNGLGLGHALLADGTTYDLSHEFIEAPLEHHAELSHLIGLHYEANGHPLYKGGDPYEHACSDHCGDFATPPPLSMLLASAAGENAALSGGLAAVMLYMSLHTATPGTSGASEYAGVTRLSNTWAAPSGGSMATSNGQTFTTSGASAVTYVGEWSAVTSGTYEIGAPLGSSVTATSITVASGAASFSAS